jgi:hypothetical protein
VTPRRWLRKVAIGPHLRRRSARFRLTALYCCLFFPSSIVLVVITYVLIVVIQHPVDQAALQQVSHLQKTPGGSITGKSLPSTHGGSTSHSVTLVTVTLPGHIVLVGSDLLDGS